MRAAPLLVIGNLHVFIGADDSQNDPHGKWESPARRITYNFRARKLMFLAPSSEFAPACPSTFFTHSQWLL